MIGHSLADRFDAFPCVQGVGLSIDEAIVFWRKSFSNMTDDNFRKGYLYNIRHNYGLEGARISYNPKRYVFVSLSFPSKKHRLTSNLRTPQLYSNHHRYRSSSLPGSRMSLQTLRRSPSQSKPSHDLQSTNSRHQRNCVARDGEALSPRVFEIV